MISGDIESDRNDPYDLNRFTSAQEGVYDRAGNKRVRPFVMVLINAAIPALALIFWTIVG